MTSGEISHQHTAPLAAASRAVSASPEPGGPKWIVSQIGARDHYLAARAFAPLGRLLRLYTDVWSDGTRSLLLRGPKSLRAMAGRYHPAVPRDKVVAFTRSTLWDRATQRLRPKRRVYDEFLRFGRWFDRKVVRHLARHPCDPSNTAFFGITNGCLETVRRLKSDGIFTIVDQIDAGRVECDIIKSEAEKWPGWATEPLEVPQAFFDRLVAEWETADIVVVNSQWSADALTAQGVSVAKIEVVPLAYEPVTVPQPRPIHQGPMTVLWLGSVILRKGIQYLIEAAKLLRDRAIRFDIVGPVEISDYAVGLAPPSVQFLGRVVRDEVVRHYQSANLFVLPTMSDGFAQTQIEAMACGLPVIATPNCGKVVTSGVDGLIVPAGDASALAAAIAALDDDRTQLAQMSEHALKKATQFSVARFADHLDAIAGTPRKTVPVA